MGGAYKMKCVDHDVPHCDKLFRETQWGPAIRRQWASAVSGPTICPGQQIPGSWPTNWLMQELVHIVKKRPLTVILPFLVLVAGIVGGVLLVREAENTRNANERNAAQTVALQAAQSIELQLEGLIQPVAALRVFIRGGMSNYTTLRRAFPSIAADLLKVAKGSQVQDLGQQLQLQPQGVISDVYPLTNVTRSAINIDVLANVVRRSTTIDTMQRNVDSFKVKVAVYPLVQEPRPLALVATTSVFVEDVPENYTFESPAPVSPFCPPDLCYNRSTKTKYWGQVAGIVYIEQILTDPAGPLNKLRSKGYRFLLLQKSSSVLNATSGYGDYALLGRTPRDVSSPEKVMIDLDSRYLGYIPWELSVSPEGGWTTNWAGMYAVVVVVSVLVASLLCALLISRVQNEALLFALIPEHMVNSLKSKHVMYTHHAVDEFANGTPAEVLLDLLSKCLNGILPPVSTVVQLRAALLSLQDLYRPANISQALEALNLDDDVAGELMRVLHGGKVLRQASRAMSHLDGSEASSVDDMNDGSEESALQEVLMQMLGGKKDAFRKGAGKTGLGTLSIASSMTSQASYTVGVRSSGSNTVRTSSMGTGEETVHAKPRRASMCLSEPIWSEVHTMLEAAWSSWTWDAFKMQQLTDGHALSTTAYFLLHRSGLIQQLGLSPVKLVRYLTALEQSYLDVPYHSSVHAADVLQTMHILLSRGGLVPAYADPIRHLACILAAAAHDANHTGLTNDFLINTGAGLAILYSDRSPLENHHLATMFTLLKQPENDFTRGLPKESRDTLRKVSIELILGTDMKQHMTITNQFRSVHHIKGPTQDYAISRRGTLNGDAQSSSGDLPHMASVDETTQMLTLQMILKISDLGAVAETHPVNLHWVSVLEQEFYKQGDQERKMGLPVSPLFDRTKPGAAKSQVGFYSFVALPIFHAFALAFPGIQPFLELAEENFRWWKMKQLEQAAPSASLSTTSEKTNEEVATMPTSTLSGSTSKPCLGITMAASPCLELEVVKPLDNSTQDKTTNNRIAMVTSNLNY